VSDNPTESAPLAAMRRAISNTQPSSTSPWSVQPNAVDRPTSTLGRRPAGRLSRNSQIRATCSTASSQLMRMLDRLCAWEAETGSVTLCAPAAIAFCAPLRLGASASTVRSGSFTAFRHHLGRVGHLRSSFAGTNDATSISLSPASASARIQRSLAAVGIVVLMLCSPSRGPTSLTSTCMLAPLRLS
jgi:hypothetical protein